MRALVPAIVLVLLLASPAAAEPVDVPAQTTAANALFLRAATPPGQTAAICLVDTGVNETPDTTAMVGRLSLDGDARDRSPSLHGTGIAAFMAAARNGYGMVGLWPRARIVSVRVNSTGEDAFTPARITEGLRLCLRSADAFGIKVAVLPFSSEWPLSATEGAELTDVVASVRAAGINVVAAAGNAAGGPVGAPANIAGVVSVGAIDTATGGLCGFSSAGAQVLAPGCRLDAANPGDGSPTATRQGTDVAAALAATALAALRTWRPDLSPGVAEHVLREAGRPSDAGPILDVANAFTGAGLEGVVHWAPPITPPTVTSTTPDEASLSPTARITVAGGATKRLRSSTPLSLSGRLLDPAGHPIANAMVTAQTRTLFPKSLLLNGPTVPLAHTVTNGSGRFRVTVPKGPSRAVLLTYGDTTAQASVVVPAQITAAAVRNRLRNGATATIAGRVAGPIPDGGAPIALEVRNHGAWIPVPTTRRWVKTTDAGRFTLSYRFLRTFQATTYRFRVVADEDSFFPYTRGHSRTIKVHVRP